MSNADRDNALRDSYIATWNEPDPQRRRSLIEQLWRDDGSHLLGPPAELAGQLEDLGFADQALAATGHEALEARVVRTYDKFVAGGEYRFTPAGDAARVGDVLKLAWQMVHRETGRVAGGGVDVLILDGDGRIHRDYQFIE